MKIIFTKHAHKKIKDLQFEGIIIIEKQILSTLDKPDHLDRITDYPRLIASKILSDKLVLRVVYKIEDDIITVITFYPARKGRYFS